MTVKNTMVVTQKARRCMTKLRDDRIYIFHNTSPPAQAAAVVAYTRSANSGNALHWPLRACWCGPKTAARIRRPKDLFPCCLTKVGNDMVGLSDNGGRFHPLSDNAVYPPQPI